MNEHEMSQQERDAAVIEDMRTMLEEIPSPPFTIQSRSETWEKWQRIAIVGEDGLEIAEWEYRNGGNPIDDPIVCFQLEVRGALDAALREIDRLRAENERLRAACVGVPDMLQVAGMLDDMDEDMISKAHALRAALASADRDGAGTAAGDATAGDGDGGAE